MELIFGDFFLLLVLSVCKQFCDTSQQSASQANTQDFWQKNEIGAGGGQMVNFSSTTFCDKFQDL
jgi:hypothetical protein